MAPASGDGDRRNAVDLGRITVTRADRARPPPADTVLADAARLFRAGRVSAAAARIAGLDRATLDATARREWDTIWLATRALGLGDAAELDAVLPAIPDDLRPDLRYRALLNHDRTGAAAAFRRRSAGAVSDRVATDWAWSLALRALHRGHMRGGFALYRNRFGAINRGPGAPTDRLHHVPAADRLCDTVFLEQGLGDSIYHLTLMKGLRGDAPLRVVAAARWRPLIDRACPEWTVVTEDRLAETGPIAANASGDYMGLAWARQGHGRPAARLLEPVRHRPPRFGILWRGGSHQNRVEERQIPLKRFLDLLPRDHRYVALQHDMTEGERTRIAADPRVDLPGFDPVADLESLVECIAGLAGVIGVDGSAIHIAGCCGVPARVLMNARPHWYWGRSGQVDRLYPGAVTVPIDAPDPDGLANWCADTAGGHAARARPRPPIRGPAFRRPVLVTGVPRSGTSLTMGLLAGAGLWTGKTVPGGPANPRGFFENARLREGLVKPLLRGVLAADPLGVRRLPEIDTGHAAPHLARLIARALSEEGWPPPQPWGYKDAKLSLLWPLWAEAFPDARWIVVTRDREAVVRSCLRTPFMRRHSDDPAFWRLLHDAYRGRQQALAAGVRGPVRHVRFEALLAGEFSALRAVAEELSLDWCDARARAFLL